jgi:uncharacterized membrane protein YphA (DoxX/SURF4 family)
MRLTLDDTPTRMERIGASIPRLALAGVFLLIGSSKFGATSPWIPMFDRIGWGQWLRYLAGTMQVAGAVLLLLPRTAAIGGLLVACTMAGAVYFDLTRLQLGFAAVIPFAIGAVATGVAMQSYFNSSYFNRR